MGKEFDKALEKRNKPKKKKGFLEKLGNIRPKAKPGKKVKFLDKEKMKQFSKAFRGD